MSIKRTSTVTRKIRAAWSGDEGRRGFTIVELLLALIISTIIMAGMVGLVASVFNVFRASNDLQALNDSSRRALSNMSRQLRDALHFGNVPPNNCTESTLTFWADIDNDQKSLPGSSSTTWADIYNYWLTEKVQFSKDAGFPKAVATVTQPPDDPNPTDPNPVTATLGSYVTSLKFYYFQANEVPTGSYSTNPTGFDPTKSTVNDNASMIRIVMSLQKGKVHHSYYQDVFLRLVVRQP